MAMRKLAAIATVLALTGCVPKEAAEPASDGAALTANESISLTVNSWGKLISHWQVNADGSGELWRLREGGSMQVYDIEKFHVKLGEQAMMELVSLTDDIRAATLHGVDCQYSITDMPYGTMTWKEVDSEGKYAFNFGCTGDKAGKVYNQIGDATEVVQKKAVIEVQPYAVEHIGPPEG